MPKKLLLEEMAPGPLPGREILWKAWQIAGHMDRRRLRGPEPVRAPSAFLARQRASIAYFGSCDPLHVEVVVDIETDDPTVIRGPAAEKIRAFLAKSNGAGRENPA